jgi:uncharacterized protein (DUF697 family)
MENVTPEPAAPADRAARFRRAETLVKDHMLMSLATGLVPVPALDLAAGLGIQIALVKRLCDLYGIPFSERVARGIVMSLLSSLGAGVLGVGIFVSGIKLLPGAGTILGIASLPTALAAFTYALGKVFVAHLELGGDLLSFDCSSQGEYFRGLFRRGKDVAKGLVPSRGSASASAPAATGGAGTAARTS